MRPPSAAALRRTVLLPVAFFLVLVVAVGSAAFWTTGSASGGSGASAATTMAAGATPTAVLVAEGDVSVSWAAARLGTGQPATGYLVKRYDADTHVQHPVLAGCTGTVATTSCTEAALPAGRWVYTVTPRIADNWVGTESAKSAVVITGDVRPASSLTLSSVSGGAYRSGGTVYYRGSDPGSFRLTDTGVGFGSGAASSATGPLTGTTTGWEHSPSTVATPSGGPYVSNPFSWSAGTTSSPSVTVTTRDVADRETSTTLTMAADSSAPSGSTIGYPDGATGTSVLVTFATGTDAGAGIASGRLQRRLAPVVDGGCGTYGSFVDIGPTEPTSPYRDDAVSNATCYQYRYVVRDNVGNVEHATGAGTARPSYADLVSGTPGLLSYWRLDEPVQTLTAADPFTGTAGARVTNRRGENGTSWTHHGGTSTAVLTDAGRVRKNATGWAAERVEQVPPTADYSVEGDFHYRGVLAGDVLSLAGRMSTWDDTMYLGTYDAGDQSWTVSRVVDGTSTTLARLGNQRLTVGDHYRVRLEMSGTGTAVAVSLFVDGIAVAAVTDTSSARIRAVGRAGFVDGELNNDQSVAKSNTTGLHLDNVQVTPAGYRRAADSRGPNTADYENGATNGAPGALPGDTRTAVRLDGLNDYVQAVPTTGFPVGAAARSTELWFRTSAAEKQALFAYGTRADDQMHGLWVDAEGLAMTAWGWGPNDKRFDLGSAVNDGAWHHVLLSYDGTSLTLYVDGVSRGTQASPRDTVMSKYGFSIGAVVDPADPTNSGYFFTGSIDEVSIYTTALTQAQASERYRFGSATATDRTGPSDGSVDATGLGGAGGRYATSTALSITASTGTDPSGVSPSGHELRRATAALAGGTCGTYGPSTLIATDPAPTHSDTVTDQTCHRYEYVVADAFGNTTTYTSGDIKVDTTAPQPPTLSFSAFTNTAWSGSGSVVHYRSGAGSGAFTVSAAASDGASGIAAYGFPGLGTGWTSTAGATDTMTFSWTGTPAAAGTGTVTATNGAGATSAGQGFTLTADDTPPSAGTVAYPDGTQTGTTVSVAFTTGTDTGSGIGNRLVQRAEASLSAGVCSGTWSIFTTVADGTNPASSPVTDTVGAGRCYRYRYVVEDRVGNQRIATSTAVLEVPPAYTTSVLGTAGLVSYYRMNESPLVYDTFTGTAGATLQSRAGDSGVTWSRQAITGADGAAVLTDAGRARKNGTNWGALFITSGTTATASYTVSADIRVMSTVRYDFIGVVGRLDTSNSNGTYYLARYEQSTAAFALYRVVNGTFTWLGNSAQALSVGSTYRLSLDMQGNVVRLLVGGVERVTYNDGTPITATGRSGAALGFGWNTGTNAPAMTSITNTTGMHLDNFQVAAAAPVVDSTGGSPGQYENGPLVGQAGALSTGETATSFDGVNDYARVSRRVADSFSIEFWFRSNQGIGTSAAWYDAAGLVDADVSGFTNDFGIGLRSDGRVVAGTGNPDVSIVSGVGGYNNSAWHHVVFTRARNTGALRLYVDGASVGTATGGTASLTAPANVTFGKVQSGTNYFAGTLDEVAFYSVALSASTVAAHYGAR